MKAITVCLTALFLCSFLFALEVPHSATPLITPENMLGEMLRVDPEDGSAESLPTKAWIWQDEDYLMVYFEAAIDENFELGQTRMRDEQGDRADFLRVQLITMPDSYFAYYYLAFPNRTLQDGTRNTNLGVDYSWNSGYSYESIYSDSLWQLTMRIPLYELRFAGRPPYEWKIILGRYHSKTEEIFSAPYLQISQGKDYFLEAQDIRLSHPIRRRMDIKLKPYIARGYDLINKTSSFDPENLGLDISLNPGQKTRIKLSFNPDFSDVPPDNANDFYNEKHQPFYSENRFFFTEDIDAFGLGNIFHSRNIRQPSFAFKATGATSILNWGVLGALDREITDDGYLVNPDDYFQVLSIRPSFRRVSVGNGLISRMNENYYNHVLSTDVDWEFIPDWHLENEIKCSLQEDDREQDSPKLLGYNSYTELNYSPKYWYFGANYSLISPDFIADAGYPRDTDYQNMGCSLNYNSPTRDRYLKNISAGTWGNYTIYGLNKGKHPQEKDAGLNVWATFRPKYNISLNGYQTRTLDLYEDEHDTYQASLAITHNKWTQLRANVRGTYGKDLIYSLSDTHAFFSGSTRVWGDLAQKLGYSLSLSYKQYDYPKINNLVVDGNPDTVKLDDRYVIGNLSLQYQHDAKAQLSVGASLDSYERVSSDSNIYGWAQFYGKLRYEFRPESFLYMGFSTRQTKYSEFYYSSPFADFTKNSATAYVKVAITI